MTAVAMPRDSDGTLPMGELGWLAVYGYEIHQQRTIQARGQQQPWIYVKRLLLHWKF